MYDVELIGYLEDVKQLNVVKSTDAIIIIRIFAN